MDREYPQKVQAIFEAVGRLVVSGRDTDQLKVSDITKEAGIGKGTAYEYFNSKEEIIGRAVCYQMHIMMRHAIDRLAAIDTLQGQLEQMIQWAQGGVSANMVYNFLKLQVKNTDNAADMQQRVSEITVIRDKFLEQVADILLKAGIRDGVIDVPEDMSYARIVMVAAIMTMLEMCISKCKGGSCKDMSAQTILDYTMRIITKALSN